MLQPRRILLISWIQILLLHLFINSTESGLIFNLKSQKQSSSPFPNVEAYEIKRENVQSFDYNRNHFSRGQGQRLSSLQQINVTRNSDLVFGDVAKPDSALLLQCEAPYSVQWIYMGDGDPEFNTNATTDVDQDTGARVYSAYLFLGSRRNLNERETGRYICISVRNKHLRSYIYIFVSNGALFTGKGLETVHYSRNDEEVRIPCSLSEPRATTTLQKKSHDGVLQCPMNDTVRFDKKEGFVLNVRRLQQPEGTYLCIADYNNMFQIIKYTIVRDDSNGSGQIGSGETEESSEFENEHSPPGSISSGNCAKGKVTCGLNALCYRFKKGGNPYVECRPLEELPPSSSTTESSDSGEGQNCHSYDDCPFELACYQKKCVNPCVVNKICGPNTVCSTQHHTPFCECREEFEGDPYSSQPGQSCQEAHCKNNPEICGPNSVCKYVEGIISCSCQPGFSTQNDGVCRPNHKEDLQVTSNPPPTTTARTTIPQSRLTSQKPPSRPVQISQSQGQAKNPVARPSRNRTIIAPTRITTTGRPAAFTLRPNNTIIHVHRPSYPVVHLPPLQTGNYNNHVIVVTTPRPPGFECYYDVDCPDNRMCIHDKCEDPCVNACGAGARCTTKNHFPRCVCPHGTTGDPFYRCSPIFPRRHGTSNNKPSSPGRPLSPSNILGNEQGMAMEDQRFHANCGGKYSPCGPNSVCQTSRNRFVCACPNDHAGDAYSSRGCYSKIGYQRCHKDEDCPHFLTCLRYQGCVNPCDIVNVCKPKRSCVPHLHKPACLKTANFEMEWQRDGLDSPDDVVETKDDLEISEIPEELKESRCFIKSEAGILSPCGRNAICYDDSKNGTEPACGCGTYFFGDPFVGCEPIPTCKYSKDCGENETCVNGHCRAEIRKQSSRNACSPSPCSNPEDRCGIDRESNSAVCIPPGKTLEEMDTPVEEPIANNERKPEKYLSRADPCVLLGDCDAESETGSMDDDDGNTTATETFSDYTEMSPTLASSSSVEGALSSLSSSIERDDDAQKQFIDFLLNYSNETSHHQSLRESRIVDA